MKAAIEWKAKQARHGGPLTKKTLDAMPPYEEYIQHLRKKFKMELTNLTLNNDLFDGKKIKKNLQEQFELKNPIER